MKLKISQEKFFSLFAVFISLATLISLIHQNRLISKNSKAAVFPYLEIYDEAQGTDNYKLVLENKGTGPAIIKKIMYSVGGKNYLGNINSLLNDKNDGLELPQMYFTYSDVFVEGLISAGERIELIAPLDSTSISNFEIFLDSSNFDFEIHYESIYNDSWIASFSKTVPKKK